MKWENVYIFISSTFNDMHAERDYLVKKVFPQLSAWCEERKLRLVDIDLRWGVSETDATQNKRVVQICLDRIDECRPFFLCFLGQRRGWMPSGGDVNDETQMRFPKLTEKETPYLGNNSVTEMEILHALIDPLHNGTFRDKKGDMKDGSAVEHAFFFLRENDYLPKIKNEDSRKIYTNETEEDKEQADRQLKKWRDEIIPSANRPVHHYTADWNETESTPEIALPLCCPTTAPTESETWKTAFRKWEKLWRDKGVVVSKNGEISDASELQKAKTYNEALTKGRLTGFQTANQDLADVIIETLKRAIEKRFGQRMAEKETPLQKELDQQAQFLRIAGEGFIERAGDFDKINDYLNSTAPCPPFAVTAFAGMGKTSLLAHFIDTYRLTGNETVHYRFIGVSDDSVSAERLVRSLLSELKEAGKIKSDIPPMSADMMNKWPDLLAEAGQNGKTILIIDALNQLETGMSDLYWIPPALPGNVKLIVSFKRGEEQAETFYRQQETDGTMIFHPVRPFESPEDRKSLVKVYLDQYFKELDENRIKAMISSEGAKYPLFLKIVLSELRVFGVHNDLTTVISNSFGDTPVKAFDAVLERMETDPAYSKIPPSVLLPHILGWIAHSRYGLSVEELSGLLVREKLTDSPEDAGDAIYIVLRQLRPYFARRDGRVDFFYESFKIAATGRYTAGHRHARTSAEWHRSLAEYFETLPLDNKHKLLEQAWQYAHAGMREKLNALLWDYLYIKAKLSAGMIEHLREDCDLVLFADDALQADREDILLLKRFLEISHSVLYLYPDQLPSQLFGTFQDENSRRIEALLAQARDCTKEPWLRPLENCFPSPLSRLLSTKEISTQAIHLLPIDDRTFWAITLKSAQKWDAIKQRRLTEFAFSEPFYSSKIIACLSADKSFTAIAGQKNNHSDRADISLFNMTTGEEIILFRQEKGIERNYHSCEFSKDNRKLLVCETLKTQVTEPYARFVRFDTIQRITLWNITERTIEWQKDVYEEKSVSGPCGGNARFGKNENEVIFSIRDRGIYLYEWNSELNWSEKKYWKLFGIGHVQLSSNKQTLFTCTRSSYPMEKTTLHGYSIYDGSFLFEMDIDEYIYPSGMAIDEEEQYLFAKTNNNIYVFSLSEKKLCCKLDANYSMYNNSLCIVNSILVSTESERLLFYNITPPFASTDGMKKLLCNWDGIDTVQVAYARDCMNRYSFDELSRSPDGRYGIPDSGDLLIDTQTGRRISDDILSKLRIPVYTFSSDSRMLALAAYGSNIKDYGIVIIDLEKESELVHIHMDLNNIDEWSHQHPYISFYDDDKKLLLITGWYFTLWDVPSLQLIEKWKIEYPVDCRHFIKQNNQVIIYYSHNNMLVYYDIQTKSVIKAIPCNNGEYRGEFLLEHDGFLFYRPPVTTNTDSITVWSIKDNVQMASFQFNRALEMPRIAFRNNVLYCYDRYFPEPRKVLRLSLENF